MPNTGSTSALALSVTAHWLLLVGRILMSIAFIFFGIMKTINTADMQSYMNGFGVPGELIWLVIALQIGCGALIVIGYQTRWAALALAGFCLVATGIFHTKFFNDNGMDLGQVSDFTKDLAAAGGFLFLHVIGAGKISVDYLVANRSPANKA